MELNTGTDALRTTAIGNAMRMPTTNATAVMPNVSGIPRRR